MAGVVLLFGRRTFLPAVEIRNSAVDPCGVEPGTTFFSGRLGCRIGAGLLFAGLGLGGYILARNVLGFDSPPGSGIAFCDADQTCRNFAVRYCLF